MLAQLVANGFLAGSSYILLAVGFALARRETGFFDFSYALQFTLGAYAAYSLYSLGLPSIAAVCLACAMSALLGALLQRIFYGRLAGYGCSPLELLVISLAVYATGQNVVAMLWGDARKTFRPSGTIGTVDLGSIVVSRSQLVGFIIALCALCGLLVAIRRTEFGRTFRAVADDPELADIRGIPIWRYRVYSQGLAGGLAGLAGVVFAMDTGLEPRMGFQSLLIAVVAVIVGSGGNIAGTAVAALGLGLVQQLSVLVLESKWQEAIAVGVMVIVLAVRPTLANVMHKN